MYCYQKASRHFWESWVLGTFWFSLHTALLYVSFSFNVLAFLCFCATFRGAWVCWPLSAVWKQQLFDWNLIWCHDITAKSLISFFIYIFLWMCFSRLILQGKRGIYLKILMVLAVFKVSISFPFSWERRWGRGQPSREKKKGVSSVTVTSSVWIV